jgi:hypothetical protein
LLVSYSKHSIKIFKKSNEKKNKWISSLWLWLRLKLILEIN